MHLKYVWIRLVCDTHILPTPGKVKRPALLIVVKLLFRAKGEFLNLPRVVAAVSTFLDSAMELPLNEARKRNSIQLLSRIWASSEIFTVRNENMAQLSWTLRRLVRTDKYYRQYQFSLSLEEAIRLHNLEMVKWLASRFQGCMVREILPGKTMADAAKKGHLDVVQWLYADYGQDLHTDLFGYGEANM
ncbi:hypothetical protein PRNP1_015133 [Phytophthora ramorum]